MRRKNMKKKMSRRDFMKIAGMTGAAGVLAACGPKAQTSEPAAATAVPAAPAAATAVPPAAEPVTITFTGWGGAEEDNGVKNAVKYFQDQTPNIKVNWIQIPENYAEKILAMVAAGTPPDDAFCYNTIYQDYAKRGLLMDITDKLKADPVVGAKDYFIEPKNQIAVFTMASRTVSAPAG